MTQHLRVLIIDNQRLLRESFRCLIEQEGDIEVIGAIGDEEAFLKLKAYNNHQIQPDVILMDIHIPYQNGVQTIRRCRQHWPESRIVILTNCTEEIFVREAFQSGAFGYLLKDTTMKDLVETIRLVGRGQMLLQPAVARTLSAAFSSQVSPPRTSMPLVDKAALTAGSTLLRDNLTEREVDVLLLLTKGASNREISQTLYITHGTVKNHISSILSKLGARDRTQAALKARELVTLSGRENSLSSYLSLDRETRA